MSASKPRVLKIRGAKNLEERTCKTKNSWMIKINNISNSKPIKKKRNLILQTDTSLGLPAVFDMLKPWAPKFRDVHNLIERKKS